MFSWVNYNLVNYNLVNYNLVNYNNCPRLARHCPRCAWPCW
jgi:hypothetical protein